MKRRLTELNHFPRRASCTIQQNTTVLRFSVLVLLWVRTHRALGCGGSVVLLHHMVVYIGVCSTSIMYYYDVQIYDTYIHTYIHIITLYIVHQIRRKL
jgi:hypothetical protein